MRGLDKAIQEAQAVKNRVSRLYGLGRISYDQMQTINEALLGVDKALNKVNNELEDIQDGRQERCSTNT